MTTMTPVPADHPLMKAWEAHKATEEYANSKRWAVHPEHVEGSLWALFSAGWSASELRTYPTAQPAQPVAKPVAALRAVQDEWIAVTDRKPEPGVTVLACYRNSRKNLRRIRAIWIPAKFEEADPEQDNVEYDEEKDCYFTPEGWYEQIDNWGDYTAVAVSEGEVEFWRAMPAFPLAGGKMMRTLWKRLVCLFTLNHIDPGARTEGDRLRCKKCGADVGGVWK